MDLSQKSVRTLENKLKMCCEKMLKTSVNSTKLPWSTGKKRWKRLKSDKRWKEWTYEKKYQTCDSWKLLVSKFTCQRKMRIEWCKKTVFYMDQNQCVIEEKNAFWFENSYGLKVWAFFTFSRVSIWIFLFSSLLFCNLFTGGNFNRIEEDYYRKLSLCIFFLGYFVVVTDLLIWAVTETT